MESTLERIQRWYSAQCDGDWEHRSGVKITSLDNPGWLVKIDLVGTKLEGRAFAPLAEGLEERDGLEHPSQNNWHSISVKGSAFEGAGDASKLEFILAAFLEWAERRG